MTLEQFEPHARRFWDLTRDGGLRDFLDCWAEQPEHDRECFLSFVVALRKALQLYHVSVPEVLDELEPERRDRFLYHWARDLFSSFSGRRYTLALDTIRASEHPAWTELALGLRKGRIALLNDQGEEVTREDVDGQHK